MKAKKQKRKKKNKSTEFLDPTAKARKQAGFEHKKNRIENLKTNPTGLPRMKQSLR